MKYLHTVNSIAVSVVPAPRWERTPVLTVQETAVWPLLDLHDYVTGAPPFTFRADGLPSGLTLGADGVLTADGTQVAGTYTVTFEAQNPAIAPLWPPGVSSVVSVAPAPIEPQGSTLQGKYALPTEVGLGIGISFNGGGFP